MGKSGLSGQAKHVAGSAVVTVGEFGAANAADDRLTVASWGITWSETCSSPLTSD